MGTGRFLSGLAWCGLLLLVAWCGLPPYAGAETQKKLFVRITECDPAAGMLAGRSFRHTNIRFELEAVKTYGALLACNTSGVVQVRMLGKEVGTQANRARARVYLTHPAREKPYPAWVEFRCMVKLE